MEDTAIVFIVVGLPIILGIGVAVYRMMLQHRQVQLLLEERKLLIEQGRELPPLRLPEIGRRWRDPYRSLRWGIILLALAVGLLVAAAVSPRPSFEEGFQVTASILLAALGCGMLLVHAFARPAESRENGSADAAGSVPAAREQSAGLGESKHNEEAGKAEAGVGTHE
jgi:hypothetical protein